MRILGIDPGLLRTGWGVIECSGNQLRFIDCQVIRPSAEENFPGRLHRLHTGLQQAIEEYQPAQAAVEESFVSVNASSTLKLGQARGAILLSLSLSGLVAHEYAATRIKQALTGNGRAEKGQVARMVQMLLPGCSHSSSDATDALAVAICHAHYAAFNASTKRVTG